MITKYDNGFKNILDSMKGLGELIYNDTIIPLSKRWGLKYAFGMGTYDLCFKDGTEIDFEKLVRINDDSDEEYDPFKEDYEKAIQEAIKKWPNDFESDLRMQYGLPIYYNKEFREELLGLYELLEREVPWNRDPIYSFLPIVH